VQVVTQRGEISEELFTDLMKYPEFDGVATGSYCELPVITWEEDDYGTVAFRVNKRDVNDDYDSYTRTVRIPEEYALKATEILYNAGWPLSGVRCRHSYDCCGQMYCDGVVIRFDEDGAFISQRVWRNV
jgi:hypothetical protein